MATVETGVEAAVVEVANGAQVGIAAVDDVEVATSVESLVTTVEAGEPAKAVDASVEVATVEVGKTGVVELNLAWKHRLERQIC